jgi:hypothetical protein
MGGMTTYIKHPEKYRSTFETAVLRAPKEEQPSREIVNQIKTNVVTGIFVHTTSQQCRIAVFDVRPISGPADHGTQLKVSSDKTDTRTDKQNPRYEPTS